MDKRYDNRTQGTFKKDIKFGTMMEKYFFNKWVELCNSRDDIIITNWNDNGIGNDGEYVKTGTNTSGADYIADLNYEGVQYDNLPIEVKWVPTAGKFTLKVNDLKAYIKEDAAILFIYNSKSPTLRKPTDYNFEKHIKRIESVADQLKWCIMFPETVEVFLDFHRHQGKIENIPYMGNKPGIILKQENFDLWFTVKDWTYKLGVNNV